MYYIKTLFVFSISWISYTIGSIWFYIDWNASPVLISEYNQWRFGQYCHDFNNNKFLLNHEPIDKLGKVGISHCQVRRNTRVKDHPRSSKLNEKRTIFTKVLKCKLRNKYNGPHKKNPHEFKWRVGSNCILQDIRGVRWKLAYEQNSFLTVAIVGMIF